MFPMGPGWAELWPKLPPNKPKLRSHVFGPSWSQVVQVRPKLARATLLNFELRRGAT
jgi:hypothetical protein